VSDEDAIAAADAAFADGDFEQARALALEALATAPDEPRLLLIAGISSLELGEDDAVEHLTALTRQRPDDPHAWRYLGLAAMEVGDVDGGMRSLRRAVELDPSDEDTLVDLALTARAARQPGEALGLLLAAAEGDQPSRRLLRTLASLAEAAGDRQAALVASSRLVQADPKDVAAALAAADLQLELGQLPEAAASFAALRSIDDDDGHASFAYHGQIEALLRAEMWRQALDVAIESTRADRLQLTTDLLQCASAKLFGDSDRAAPPWAEVLAALAEERAAHRRMHAEQEAV
jgi:Flp pilus assembly protein TadD